MSTSNDILARRARLTPQQLAKLESRLRGQSSTPKSSDEIGRRPKDSDPPLSFAQQRLWFLDQWAPGGCLYNVPRALRFKGDLNLPALEKSLAEVIRRHESLRTTFPSEDGLPRQLIHAPGEGVWASCALAPVIDLSGLSEEARESEARNLAYLEARLGFDLANGPLLRMKVARISEDDHLVLFTMHHIVTDGWSMGVLVREISAIYEAFSQGRKSPLKEMPIQYADFAYWQRRRLEGSVLNQQLDYWKKQLAGCPTTLEMPADYQRPPEQSHRGAIEPVAIAQETLRALKSLGREEGATLFMTLLAAFYALLYRYTGQADILVGTPIANRNREELEGLIGFFVNTLALRGRLSGDMTFRDLLRQARETTLGAYANQDLPFERLVEEIQPERNLSQTPLFQVMFILQNAPKAEIDLPGVRLIAQEAYAGVSKFDLSLALTETEQGVFGGIEYNADIFEAETIRRMAATFVTLIDGIAANPGGRIRDLPALSADDRRRLAEWNETSEERDLSLCCHHLFERQAEAYPDLTALICEQRQLSYSQLNSLANRMAHLLISLGLGPESRVAICLPRSAEMVIAVLAVLKAGACYVPLDSSLPPDRLRFILEDSAAELLICQPESLDSLPGLSIKTLFPDQVAHHPAALGDHNPVSGVSGDNLAYVIYTSGSTGRPKGIALPHRALANLIEWHQRELISRAPTLQFASLGFDASFHEMFGCWAGAGAVVITPESVRMDPEALASLIERHQIRKAILPVVMLQELAALDGQERLSSLRELITTGEQLSLTQQTRETIGRLDLRLHNHYGPSESHVVTAHSLEREADQWPSLPPIGRPISNCRIYLLDQWGREIPPGAVGEIYIGGECLARGYINRADLTAERFIPDAVSGLAGERLYRSGDLGRYDKQGNLQYLGRADRQVKLRGHRIELGEVEAAISANRNVNEAVVELKTEGVEKALVAYVTLAPQAVAEWKRELREELGRKLPQYMIPGRYVEVERIPLTVNGKVDREALSRMETSEETKAEEKRGPSDEIEEAILRIWERALGREGIGVEENFFELGGHSLKATQVISRIGRELGREIGLRDLFSRPSVKELAAKVREVGRREEKEAVKSEEEEYELSAGQKSVWIESQSEEGSRAYNLPAAYLIEGELNVEALKSAFRGLIERHEALRTRIVEREGEPRQRVEKWEGLGVEEVDVRGDESERRAREIARAEAREAFDLRRGPLVRAKLVRMGEKRWAFLMTAHHLVVDGWSQRVMMREMVEMYRAKVEGREARLREKKGGYREYVERERREEGSERRKMAERYWEERLRGIGERKRLETDYERRRGKSYEGDVLNYELGEELSRGLRRKGAELGASLYMTLLGGVKALLYRMSGEERVVVGSPVMRRGEEEDESHVGLYLNTVVLRTEVRGEDRLKEVVDKVRETVISGMEHSGVGLEKVSGELRREWRGEDKSLYDVVVTMEEEGAEDERDEGEIDGVRMEWWGEWNEVSKSEIWIGLSERGERIGVAINYDRGLYERRSMERLYERLERVLKQIVEDDGMRVDELDLGEARSPQLSTPDIALDF